MKKTRKRINLIGLGAFFIYGSLNIYGQVEQQSLGDILSKPIKIERTETVTSVPIVMRSGKIYLNATIDDFSGEFVFDTGSPTILDQTVVEELGFKIIGENTGRDANGKEVTMKIAMADSIMLGGTVFYDVPVMVHDFASMPLGKCYLSDGVLGSELLPGSAWRLDLSNASLKIASSINELPALEGTKSTPLHLFNYPFAPIIDYSVERYSDKALFDTGNASEVALFEDIERDKWVRKEIDQNTTQQGRGRLGTSAGGIGDIVPLKNFQIKSLNIGNYAIGRTQVKARPVPPTLIGAGILKSHTVTLDYLNAEFLISPSTSPLVQKPRSGFALSINGDKVEVTQIFDSSDAQKAGLLLGDEVVEINGSSLSLSTDTERCETSRWLSDKFDASSVKTIKIYRDDESIEIFF